MAESKKKKTTKKTSKAKNKPSEEKATQPKSEAVSNQEVPPREPGVPPTVAPKVTQPPTAPAPKYPEFSPEEINILQFYVHFLNNKKHEAGFGIEGAKFLYHDIEALLRVPVVAIQRTQLCAELVNKLKEKDKELELYKQALMDKNG